MSNNVRFIHVRNPNAKLFGAREFTVAYSYDEVSGQFFAGYAYCSLNENYVKKTGNALAKARLEAGMNGEELGREFYLPVHNVTLFNSPSELRQFAVCWGAQFA